MRKCHLSIYLFHNLSLNNTTKLQQEHNSWAKLKPFVANRIIYMIYYVRNVVFQALQSGMENPQWRPLTGKPKEEGSWPLKGNAYWYVRIEKGIPSCTAASVSGAQMMARKISEVISLTGTTLPRLFPSMLRLITGSAWGHMSTKRLRRVLLLRRFLLYRLMTITSATLCPGWRAFVCGRVSVNSLQVIICNDRRDKAYQLLRSDPKRAKR